MTAIGWDHVQIFTPDPEAAAAWFARHFGALVSRQPNRIDAEIDGVAIFIATPAVPLGASPPHPYPGFDHIGLRVDDLDAFVARLKAEGVRFAREIFVVRPGVRACFIEGPDGIHVELLERRPT
jgi:lactoylglutathione lyase